MMIGAIADQDVTTAVFAGARADGQKVRHVRITRAPYRKCSHDRVTVAATRKIRAVRSKTRPHHAALRSRRLAASGSENCGQ